MERERIDYSQVKGWAVDADPKNDPTYPIRKRVSDEHEGYKWERPPQQRSDVEILHSNERPNLTATFGTTAPPAGLSGVLRRLAFNYSESSYGHWLPLILADKVSVFEGYLQDMARGRVPNVFAERGWKAEWRYNRKSLVTRVAVGAALITVAATLLGMRKRAA